MSTEKPQWDEREMPGFFQKWRKEWGDPELSPDNYLDFEGGLRFVLAAAWLFCPETVEYRGCVFLEDRFDPANVDNWFRDLDGSREHVEIMVNAVALWDVFTNTDLVDENRFGEELPQLAMAIGECWQGILSRRYPDRDVTVRVTGEEDRDYGPTVTFWTQPARGPRPED